MKPFDIALKLLNDNLKGREFTYKSKYGGVSTGFVEHIYCVWHVKILSKNKITTSPKFKIVSSKGVTYNMSEVDIEVDKDELSKLEQFSIKHRL